MRGNKEDIYALTVKVNNVFLAGNHRIIVSARDKSDRVIDQVRYIAFEVLPASMKTYTVKHTGVVQIYSEWSVPVMLAT